MKSIIFLQFVFFILKHSKLYISSFNIKTNHKMKLGKGQTPTLLATKDYDVITMIKRPETYYTQGIFFDEKHNLIESGGLYGESVLVKMEYPSLKIITKQKLDKKLFGEGVAICGDKVFQLTYYERKILQYSYPQLQFEKFIDLDGKLHSGWGLANLSDQNLVATDGTNKLFILDCMNNLSVIQTIPVFFNGIPLDRLNALTIVDGYIYANRYYDNRIYKINPKQGSVVKIYDFNSLVGLDIQAGTLNFSRIYKGDVLNGIAYDSIRKVFLLTGKRWGHYYEVVLK